MFFLNVSLLVFVTLDVCPMIDTCCRCGSYFDLRLIVVVLIALVVVFVAAVVFVRFLRTFGIVAFSPVVLVILVFSSWLLCFHLCWFCTAYLVALL